MRGRAIGVDMTAAMRERALASARAMGFDGAVEVREGDTEWLPLEDGAADAVISIGVLNLTTAKERVFSEIARALRPGRLLLLAGIVVERELSEAVGRDIDLWTGWLSRRSSAEKIAVADRVVG